jgi:hypothetical protein
MNTSTSKPASKPIITDNVDSQITSAFQVLFNAVNTYGETVAPTFEQVGVKGWERLAARSLIAVAARQAHLKEQEVAAFRQGVRDAIEPHLDRARADKAEYDALSPTLKSRLGAFQTYILVPVSDMSEVFGSSVELPAQVKKLQDMGYKLSKSGNGTFHVRVDLPKSILGDDSK